jgi:hypothetical protein
MRIALTGSANGGKTGINRCITVRIAHVQLHRRVDKQHPARTLREVRSN